MGSNESHFNVSLILSDKVTRQCPQTTTFEEKGEAKRGPSAYQPNALPLGQTVSSIPIFPIVSRFDLACGFLPFGLSLFCLYLCLVLSYLRLCCVWCHVNISVSMVKQNNCAVSHRFTCLGRCDWPHCWQRSFRLRLHPEKRQYRKSR